MLTIMDYEKKYKESLERARESLKDGGISNNTIAYLESIFPELKESEDEIVRKTIIRFFKDQYTNETEMYDGKVTVGKVIGWLERQGQIKESTCGRCRKAQPSHSCSDITALGRCYIEGEQKLTEWSEDERIRKALLELVHDTTGDELWIDYNVHKEEAIAWLEKQGEKPQIQHKYNVGDWIVNKYGDVYQVKEVMTGSYNLLCTSNAEEINSISQVDNNSRLLTMHDIQILEKQGEQKYTQKDIDDAYLKGIADVKREVEKQDEQTENMKKEIAEFIFMSREDIKHRHDWIKCLGYDVKFFEDDKQYEQKSADKVEPKFKVGDWIVDKSGLAQQVLDFRGGIYTCTYNSFTIDYESNYHLWSIQDAKSGDVLAITMYPEGTWIGIFKAQNGCVFSSYCFVNTEGTFKLGTYNHGNGREVHPATKEQLDLLFKKMHEAGYEWDAEKLELKKYKPVAKKEVTGVLKEMLDNIDPVELEETKKEMIKECEQASASTLTQEKVQKLHDHLEMHRKLGDIPKATFTNSYNERELQYEFDRVIDKLNEIIGKLGDLYSVLSKPYMYPPRNPIPGMDVWYKTHGVENVPPVTCSQTVTTGLQE